jgi:hypothetical protein
MNFEQFIGRDAEGSVYDVTSLLRRHYSEGAEENYYKLQ